jgi:preprotein translocase subunit SecD
MAGPLVLALGFAVTGAACGSEDETPTASTASTASTTGNPEEARGTAPADSVTFRPVLEEPGTTTGTGPPTITLDQLGPVVLDGTGIVGVEVHRQPPAAWEADEGGVTWSVDLQLTDDAVGIEAFNAVAAECYELTTSCPTGILALVVDDDVVTAPTIATPSFEADQIRISAGGTESEARDLAARITAAAHGG